MDTIALQRAFARFHLGVYQRTGGRLGRRLGGNTALVLTTVGRRTGERRSTVLAYAPHGDEYVVVASNYGGDRPPAWLLNLRAQPRVEVLVGPRRTPADAREVAPGDPDYPELWRLVNANNRDRFIEHQRATKRPISLVALRPLA